MIFLLLSDSLFKSLTNPLGEIDLLSTRSSSTLMPPIDVVTQLFLNKEYVSITLASGLLKVFFSGLLERVDYFVIRLNISFSSLIVIGHCLYGWNLYFYPQTLCDIYMLDKILV